MICPTCRRAMLTERPHDHTGWPDPDPDPLTVEPVEGWETARYLRPVVARGAIAWTTAAFLVLIGLVLLVLAQLSAPRPAADASPRLSLTGAPFCDRETGGWRADAGQRQGLETRGVQPKSPSAASGAENPEATEGAKQRVRTSDGKRSCPLRVVPAVIAVVTGGTPADGASASATPVVSVSAPDTAAIGTALEAGGISWASESHGHKYLAVRAPRGTLVRICGDAGCLVMRSTDYGPSSRIDPPRIADLAVGLWERQVCGLPRSAGICIGTVEYLSEDGADPTLPPTDTLPEKVK